MGDMADYYLMSEPIEYDDFYLGADKEIGCKKCGETGLHWARTKHEKWWLIEANGEWHTCKDKK